VRARVGVGLSDSGKARVVRRGTYIPCSSLGAAPKGVQLVCGAETGRLGGCRLGAWSLQACSSVATCSAAVAAAAAAARPAGVGAGPTPPPSQPACGPYSRGRGPAIGAAAAASATAVSVGARALA